MSWFDWGNPVVISTMAPSANPTTGTLAAELDSTQLGTVNYAGGRGVWWRVNWIIGGDTAATWQLEAATSTALSAGQDIVFIKTPLNQSGQYVTTHQLTANMRLRARLQTAIGAGTVVASIQAEPLS